MPYRFRCKYCGCEILIKYLKTGDEAQCKNCGRLNIVPGNEYFVPEYKYFKPSPPRELNSPLKSCNSFDNQRKGHPGLDTWILWANIALVTYLTSFYLFIRTVIGWPDIIDDYMISISPFLLLIAVIACPATALISVIVWFKLMLDKYPGNPLSRLSKMYRFKYVKLQLMPVVLIVLIELILYIFF